MRLTTPLESSLPPAYQIWTPVDEHVIFPWQAIFIERQNPWWCFSGGMSGGDLAVVGLLRYLVLCWSCCVKQGIMLGSWCGIRLGSRLGNALRGFWRGGLLGRSAVLLARTIRLHAVGAAVNVGQ